MQQFNTKQSTSWGGGGNVPLFPDAITIFMKKTLKTIREFCKVLNCKIYMQKSTDSFLGKHFHSRRHYTHENSKETMNHFLPTYN